LPVCAGNFHFRAPISRSVRAFSGPCGHFSIRAGDLPVRAGQLPVRAAIFPSVRPFFDSCGQKAPFLMFFQKSQRDFIIQPGVGRPAAPKSDEGG
jgi:hypothetical protein